MGDTVDWGEQRATQRQRTFKRGCVLVAGVEVSRCTIRDMSLEGARVVLPDPGSLPETFTLMIGDEKLTREVEVRSRSSTGMGVRFLRPLEPRDIGAEFLRHSSRETRKLSADEARKQLVERARAGVERMMLGEAAPALEMPEPTDGEVSAGVVDDDAAETETGASTDLETESVRPEAMPLEAHASAEPEARWDDGRGDGELAAVPLRVPPRRVRRLLPWLSY